MEDKEIEFNLEDIRNMLKKWEGTSLNSGTIENIVKDFRLKHLKNLR